jgi:hypothetical protein
MEDPFTNQRLNGFPWPGSLRGGGTYNNNVDGKTKRSSGGGVHVPAYEKYGISVELVERMKGKMKEPATKERVKTVLTNVSKTDLQNRAKVKKLLGLATKALGEKLTDQQTDNVVRFVVAQKIDPNNALHLIKLWNMFR